ncbi:ATP-grasp domain-containing protein [uncultured Methanocorpusculum sp.]|nr:ATP-grasp domain-containing protein [uncultured Methanocorpusculum sp.]
MIILEKPYVSDLLLEYLAAKKVPVLQNEYAVSNSRGNALHLIDTKEAVERYHDGERIYTVSENALDWIYANLPGSELVRKIGILKDKALFRKTVSNLYPNLFFKEVTLEELRNGDHTHIPYPVIMKPSVGFFSVGVYALFNEDDLKNAVLDIEKNIIKWAADFPETVIGSTFLLEQYIRGSEYAIDAYYDTEGKPVILNIFTHRFASESDVRDRIYYTSAEIIGQYLEPFTRFLERINTQLHITDFPMHIEVRVTEDDVIPIEFNPLRFAGSCSTDISYYAYGINTVDYYLNQIKPDFAEILAKKSGKIYSMILVDKGGKEIDSGRFDYKKLYNAFEHVLDVRKVEAPEMGLFAFLFTETSVGNEQELDRALVADFSEYLLE